MNFKVKKWQASVNRGAIANQLMLMGIPFVFDGKALVFDVPEVVIKVLPNLDKDIRYSAIAEVINEKAVRNRR